METVNATLNIRLTGPGILVGIQIHRRTQKSPHANERPQNTGWRRQTDTQTDILTDGHGDSMTNSAQRGQVGESSLKKTS